MSKAEREIILRKNRISMFKHNVAIQNLKKGIEQNEEDVKILKEKAKLRGWL
ncbi:hypothetical protein [Oceanobacillus senegalensis]|uniref:hypothetical protein n=1 Tax=Oceanobacillus senegalensis TaxID=1936063 RepID=UPI0015C4A229|nr:hypothetical protein [Oceanobacillus senegalensis]